ncbi:hypothetical protein M8C21_011181 [Ambrosia artemisiifolia]|uniref:mitogen-activated protein kinase kinase kinase n=1 Tax=Ambrosia artemisiifolia TaxID=4212 RepID=A0AAD5C7E6_AMBAR|nr:hypothetical protein M8C21_011181 [Ambrosia artemisiifolia]
MSFMKDFDHLKIEKKDIALATNNFDPNNVIGSGGFGRVYKGELSSPEGLITEILEDRRKRVDFLKHLNEDSFRGLFENWQKGDFLGRGMFSTVYKGYTKSGFFFAVKEFPLLDQGSQGKQTVIQLEQEVSLLRQLDHENIVRYFGTDKDDGKLYIFVELMTKGSLAKIYQKYKLRESQVSAYTKQILSGLNYLHERKVVHRDIKCAKILVDASGSVKLADFGLAIASALNGMQPSKGSAHWMAPEVYQQGKDCGFAADIWSLGCTVLEMFTSKHPYSDLEGVCF